MKHRRWADDDGDETNDEDSFDCPDEDCFDSGSMPKAPTYLNVVRRQPRPRIASALTATTALYRGPGPCCRRRGDGSGPQQSRCWATRTDVKAKEA